MCCRFAVAANEVRMRFMRVAHVSREGGMPSSQLMSGCARVCYHVHAFHDGVTSASDALSHSGNAGDLSAERGREDARLVRCHQPDPVFSCITLEPRVE